MLALTGAMTVAPTGPATATGDPMPGISTAARAEADRVAGQVRVLTGEYGRRRQAADRSAVELAAAFSAARQADREAAEAAEAVRRARVRQAARVRSLYRNGEVSVTLAVLTASSGEDALWRATVGRRIGIGVLHAADAEVQQSLAADRHAGRAARQTERAGRRLAQAQDRFDEEARAAQLVLEAAERRLADLSERARRLAAAERAAAELAAARAAARASARGLGPVDALGIPADYALTYRAAAGRCPGLRWSLLAALGQVESGHGRNNGPSSAGAVGPMQFMPATFEAYGVDGDNDGVRDPWNHADAIPSAAAYLCVSGLDETQAGVRRALLAYNHAEWYVDLVLATEQAIIGQAAP